MRAGFLILATTGESAGRAYRLIGPTMILLILVVVVLAIAIAVVSRFARRRFMDQPAPHKAAESADPWVEAGRRIAPSPDRRKPAPPREPTDPDASAEDDDGATP